jgi:hypothetical protein
MLYFLHGKKGEITMGKQFDYLLPEHADFIRKQRLFFVGSAPLSEDGHVNLSPKGHDVLRIFSTTELAYLDLTGSGNETSAHLAENGRITLMFSAFEGPPMILRVYGTGHVILPGSSEWERLISQFELLPGARQIIYITLHKVQTSCGFAVPNFTYTGERDTLQRWAAQKGEEGIRQYHHDKNRVSLDGLPTPLAAQWSN